MNNAQIDPASGGVFTLLEKVLMGMVVLFLIIVVTQAKVNTSLNASVATLRAIAGGLSEVNAKLSAELELTHAALRQCQAKLAEVDEVIEREEIGGPYPVFERGGRRGDE